MVIVTVWGYDTVKNRFSKNQIKCYKENYIDNHNIYYVNTI